MQAATIVVLCEQALVLLQLTEPGSARVWGALKEFWGYTGAIDGIAGEGTRAAFARYGSWCADLYGY